jgi:hypothetical protein
MCEALPGSMPSMLGKKKKKTKKLQTCAYLLTVKLYFMELTVRL